MGQYHISASGEAAPCHATLKACPLGLETPHGEFANRQEAQAWAEKELEANYGCLPKPTTLPHPNKVAIINKLSQPWPQPLTVKEVKSLSRVQWDYIEKEYTRLAAHHQKELTLLRKRYQENQWGSATQRQNAEALREANSKLAEETKRLKEELAQANHIRTVAAKAVRYHVHHNLPF